MNKKRNRNNKGFSLIELIIAIAILIILTGLLAPQFMKYIEKSRLAKDMQTLDTVYTSVQGAIADEDAYEGLLDIMNTDATKAISTAGGISLEDLMKVSTTNGKKFVDELHSILGKDAAAVDKSFQSKVANSETDGKVWVSVDANMQVVVAYSATGADAPADSGETSPTTTLKVGANSATGA